MDRDKCIQEILEAIQRTKQRVCTQFSKLPSVAITPSQWSVLHTLHQQEKLSVKELARSLSITGSAVTQITKELEEKKLVKRTPDKVDKRSINIELSNGYKRAMDTLHKSFSKELAPLFSKLTDKELLTLNKLHRKIANQ